EVAQQPPEALGPAHRAIGDHEDPVADAGACSRLGELILARERMPSARPGRRRQVGLDVEKRRARDVSFEVELAAASGLAELPTAVDELVAPPPTVVAPVSLRDGGEAAPALAVNQLGELGMFAREPPEALVEEREQPHRGIGDDCSCP